MEMLIVYLQMMSLDDVERIMQDTQDGIEYQRVNLEIRNIAHIFISVCTFARIRHL